MSAIETIAMREPEDFPLDFFNLNLEDYHLQYDGLSQLSLDIPSNDLPSDWLRVTESGTGCTSPTKYAYETQMSTDIDNAAETFIDIKQFASTTPYSTPSASSSRCPSGYTSPTTSMTPVFTPSVSPFGSYSSSPTYGHTSPLSNISSTGKDSKDASNKTTVPRHKRKSHIDAELRRRSKIQTAFDDLKSLVPDLNENGAKANRQSKSAMLSKTVEFCRKLRDDKKHLQREAKTLRQEMQALTAEITVYQDQLPASGIIAPDAPQANPDRVAQMFEDYVKAKSLANWKFWIFSLFIRPLFETYNDSVVTESSEAFCSSAMTWVQDKLSLVSLRPALLNTLRYLSRKTSIMSSPENLPKEATVAAIKSTLSDTTHSDSQAMELS